MSLSLRRFLCNALAEDDPAGLPLSPPAQPNLEDGECEGAIFGQGENQCFASLVSSKNHHVIILIYIE